MAATLAAQKLANLEPANSALNLAIADAVERAERIFQRIDMEGAAE
jgi:hypothetical protein